MIKVTCLGGAGSVTGSSYLIESVNGRKALVDCGMFQGSVQMENRNTAEWGFDPKTLNTLFLTHAHIDHSGRIPKLVKDGFRGRIFTSQPTAELSEIMLLDSAHIQEIDAESQTKKNKRQLRGPILPLYTTRDAEESIKLFSPVEADVMIQAEPGIKARLRNAGHILGSSILELWVDGSDGETKLVFSGDIGKSNQLIVKDPYEIFAADYLFVESTYGNRLHRSFEDSKKELLDAILHAVSNGEKVIIPAFAVERTQEILYILAEFYRAGALPKIPVYLDSPLAIKATEIFMKNKKFYDEDAMALVNRGIDPFFIPNLRFTPSTKESMEINESQRPAIIMAGNGMCTAGRIKHHLKHNLWRPGASIVMVGFQAIGTTGRSIVDGAKSVKIFGEGVSVKAKVYTIGGFSAHADQKDLLGWVSHFTESRPRVFVVHGEPATSQVLADKIHENFKLEVHIPVWKERLILKPREMITERPSTEAAPADLLQESFNSIIDIEKELERIKKTFRKKAGEISRDDIDRLRFIREELQSMQG
jgi:metallo-beta-lactamase family protein